MKSLTDMVIATLEQRFAVHFDVFIYRNNEMSVDLHIQLSDNSNAPKIHILTISTLSLSTEVVLIGGDGLTWSISQFDSDIIDDMYHAAIVEYYQGNRSRHHTRQLTLLNIERSKQKSFLKNPHNNVDTKEVG